jgi:hypothetical protein
MTEPGRDGAEKRVNMAGTGPARRNRPEPRHAQYYCVQRPDFIIAMHNIL